MELLVKSSVSKMEQATAEEKANSVFMIPNVIDGTYAFYQWDTDGFKKLSSEEHHNSNEYLYAINDSDDKLLLGIHKDSDVYFGCGIPSQIKEYVDSRSVDVENNEWLYVILDKDNKIVSGIKR